MDILLFSPPFQLSEDTPYSKTGAVLPPLGLLYIASYVRTKHPEVNIDVLDAPAMGLTLGGFGEKIGQYDPDVVGATIYTTTFSSTMRSLDIIKAKYPKCTVVLGGPHASIHPEECLRSPSVDIVVLGEGEEVFSELLEFLKKGEDPENVPNLVYKRNGKIIHTRTEPRLVDLDETPFPARDLIDMSRYRPAYGVFKRLPATNMITSRGCPFRCSFCSKAIFGSRTRYQSPRRIIDEIRMLMTQYGIKEISFSDDSFTLNRKRVEDLFDLMIESKLDLTWSCSTRVNLVTPEFLEKMKASGCISICYGIESGSPEILKKVNKGFTLERARKAIKWTKDAGIQSRASYIFGLPGETRETIQKTIDLSLELDTDFVIYNIAIPLPNTEIYREAKENGLLLHDGVDLYDRSDGPHPNIRLSDVTADELVSIYNAAYKKYYFRPSYIAKQLRAIRSPNDLIRSLKGLANYLGWIK